MKYFQKKILKLCLFITLLFFTACTDEMKSGSGSGGGESNTSSTGSIGTETNIIMTVEDGYGPENTGA